MARIRTIKPEFWVSEQVAECSTNARLTFIGLWNFSDDRGVHPAKPKTLKAELFPMDDVSAAQVAEWVAELLRVGLVREFVSEEDGAAYWHVTGWDRHQRIDRPSNKHPAPPPLDSANARRAPPEDIRRGLDEPSEATRRAPPPGVEGNGEEGNGEDGRDSLNARRPRIPAADRGSRLPSDWVLPEEWRAWVLHRRPDLDPDATAEVFANHWHAKPGADGRKADWFAAWRYWCLKQRVPTVISGARATPRRPSVLNADEVLR